MSIKTTFTIKDLENLTGIKAHTIRIWEKRYNLFHPDRTSTNIRRYDLENLKKILNVATLYRNGFQVSEIAGMEYEKLLEHVSTLSMNDKGAHKALQAFKVAMFSFDVSLFQSTWKDLKPYFTFDKIIVDIAFPLLKDIGTLWATDTIKPAHERFVSTFIIQKILSEIESLQITSNKGLYTYVLFLPLNEIHEIGLLFAHYQLLARGDRSIYLGQSIPINNLIELQKAFSPIRFVSSFTVEPQKGLVQQYLKEFSDQILINSRDELHVTGNNSKILEKLHTRIYRHSNIQSLVNKL